MFHKSETCFRRYETVITECLTRWPHPVRFKTSRAPATDAARCRDAISAFRSNNWIPSSNPDLFYKLKSGEIRPSAWIEGDSVIIGLKTKDTKTVVDDDQLTYESLSDEFGAINFSPLEESDVVSILRFVDLTIIDFPVAIDLKWKDTAESLATGLMNVALRPDEASNKLYIF